MKCPHSTTTKTKRGALVCADCEAVVARPSPVYFHPSWSYSIDDKARLEDVPPEAVRVVAQNMAAWVGRELERRMLADVMESVMRRCPEGQTCTVSLPRLMP